MNDKNMQRGKRPFIIDGPPEEHDRKRNKVQRVVCSLGLSFSTPTLLANTVLDRRDQERKIPVSKAAIFSLTSREIFYRPADEIIGFPTVFLELCVFVCLQ